MTTSLIDLTGQGNQYLNLDHTRLMEVKRHGPQRVALMVTYSDGEEDMFVIPLSRYMAVEDMLQDLLVVAP